MSFLPNEDREPVKGNYMRFKEGANKFRVLSSAIVGNEAWEDTEEGRRPVRFRTTDDIPARFAGELKYFWAFVVWNYQDERVQILEITQKGIRDDIRGYTQDEDWGDPKEYDITVTRSGDGLDTKYQTKVSPKKKIDPAIEKAYKALTIDLEALYTNDDPFAGGRDIDERGDDSGKDEVELDDAIDQAMKGEL